MTVIDCVQGSEEWFKARCGIPTASCFNKFTTPTGKPSIQRLKYMQQLAGERITGKKDQAYQSDAMKRGVELEPEARALYEIITKTQVQSVGFCLEGSYGASPDGLVGDEGCIEIKCPGMSTHVSYLVENEVPQDYVLQVQGILLVTGREWCDFVSYYPEMKPLIVRVFPDTAIQLTLHNELSLFCSQLDDLVNQIK